jgi:ferric-dicitrate binding protein FerR (iron transport regulator)
MASKVVKHAAALEELEELHRAGKISDARYELHKANLLSEATRPRRPWSVRLLIWFGIVIVAFVVLRIAIAMFDAFVSTY